VAGEELGGGAEGAGAGSQSHRGLHPGPDDGSSDEAGRADGARRDTEDGQGRHVGSGVLRPGVNGLGGEGRGGWGKGRRTKRRVSRLDFAGGVVPVPCGLTVSAESSPDVARLISNACG
jgi:hypothetical protein